MASEEIARILPCPRCRVPTRWDPKAPYRPFCSERCKLIDLGAWANEDHVIPGDPVVDASSSPDEPDDYQ